MKERDLVVLAQCVICKKEVEITVNFEDYFEFTTSSNRRHIQDIFPYLTAGEREMLLSGVCNECFNEMFKEEM